MTDQQPLAADDLLRALVDGGVEFLLIGAFAVAAHGVPRATTDLDIVPEPSAANLERLVAVLDGLDASSLPLDIPGHGRTLDVEWLSEGGNFQFATSLGQLDVMQFIAPPDVGYRDLAREALETEVLGMRVLTCAYPDLVRMKEAAGREQDLLDLKLLREARGED